MNIDKLETEFRNRVNLWAKKMQIFPLDVHLKDMRKKWGYCTSNGIVHFNKELLFLEAEIQDFVIVHELLHLKIPNHGKLFKTMMAVYLPDWQKTEDKLKNSKEA